MNLVFNFIDNRVNSLSPDKSNSNKIRLVTDEIYSNIVLYSGATRAKVCLSKTEQEISLSFYDNGKTFNPMDSQIPDTTLNAEDREVGGPGIYIVKKTASKIDYSNKDGFNILTVVFER